MEAINKSRLTLFLMLAVAYLLLPAVVEARVSGPCADCHTMHSSQNGVTTTANDQLLNMDCVACHSSTTGLTIVDRPGGTSAPLPGNTGVPIVYNINGATDSGTGKYLAGGNFYYLVAGGDETHGHNVKGISAPDTLLSGAGEYAPGAISGNRCAGSCHQSLASDLTAGGTPLSTPYGGGVYDSGCTGCHLYTGHHSPLDGSNGGGDAYRFLGGHGGDGLVGVVQNNVGGAGGTLFEDSDWEQTTVWPDVNKYKSQTTDSPVSNELSIGRFCAGCHSSFHAYGNTNDAMFNPGEVDNHGDRDATPNNNFWLRHPTNVPIPAAGIAGTDYEILNTVGYSADIPVARAPAVMNQALIQPGFDQVFCLSCHRAHGSPYPDALRFDYSGVVAHTGGPGLDNGCFFCHRTKDD